MIWGICRADIIYRGETKRSMKSCSIDSLSVNDIKEKFSAHKIKRFQRIEAENGCKNRVLYH
jgi:hypothetical protein